MEALGESGDDENEDSSHVTSSQQEASHVTSSWLEAEDTDTSDEEVRFTCKNINFPTKH